MKHTTQNSRIITAPAEKLYNAVTTPEAIEFWQVPGNMTGKVHAFDLREGGGYQMSLYYPDDEEEMSGKTRGKEDRFAARFVELKPPYKVVESIIFETDNPDFFGEMTMEVTFEPVDDGTKVTFLFKDIPTGIRPEDNEAGTLSSLEKLARYVEELREERN